MHSLAINTVNGIVQQEILHYDEGNNVKSEGTTPHTCPNLCWLPVLVIRMMEWTEFHVYVTIVGLLKAGHSAVKIHTLLRPLKRYLHG